MAVPKTKQSKSRTNKRFANYKATAATLVECPHCHELKIAHRVCKNCGYYDGKEVVAQEEEKKEQPRRAVFGPPFCIPKI